MTERTAPRPVPELDDDPRGVGVDLDRADAELTALRALDAAEARCHDEARVYDASIRWGAFVSGRWQRLALLHGRGALGDGERARYEQLEGALRELAPSLERLGLPRPPL